MDAKPEIVHAIYHQLLTLGDETESFADQLQFIARIITSDRPLWVIDILAPFGFSSVRLNHHFTGNPAGDTAALELDGIPMQIIGGYGIQRAALRGFPHPALLWANLPINATLPLRYLSHLVKKWDVTQEALSLSCTPRLRPSESLPGPNRTDTH